jgi:hypothetical protein
MERNSHMSPLFTPRNSTRAHTPCHYISVIANRMNNLQSGSWNSNPLQKLPTSTKTLRTSSPCVCEPHIASLTFSMNSDTGYIKHWCDSYNYETQKFALSVKRDANFQFYKASALCCHHIPPIFKETQRRLYRHDTVATSVFESD